MHTLKNALSFYGIAWDKPYYISSGRPILKYPEKAFRIDFYAFCICTSGSIDVEIDSEKQTISKNGFLLLSPSSYLKFRKMNNKSRIKLLFFEKNFLLKNVSNPFIIEKTNVFKNKSFSIVEYSSETRHLLNLLYYLEERSKKDSVFKKEIVRTIIFNILLEIADVVNSLTSTSIVYEKTETFLEFKKLVKNYILENHTVDFYAKKLCISNKYLIEIVKKSCGKTPHIIINEILLQEAYVLLGNTSLSIAQIAYKLQFNSSSAFGRFFKKYTCVSPSEYRRIENLF